MPFIGQRREGRRCCGGETADGEKRGWGSTRFRREKEHKEALGSLVEGRPEDVVVQRWPTAGVGPKACLGQILLWRSNSLPKWNGLGKIYSWTERKLWRQIWAGVV
jgi:hypothetical protein